MRSSSASGLLFSYSWASAMPVALATCSHSPEPCQGFLAMSSHWQKVNIYSDMFLLSSTLTEQCTKVTSMEKISPRIRFTITSTLIFCSYAFGTGLLEEFRDKSYSLKCSKNCFKNCFSRNVEGQSANENEIP